MLVLGFVDMFPPMLNLFLTSTGVAEVEMTDNGRHNAFLLLFSS